MEEERVDEIFARIGDMELELDYDPIERGPKFLNTMVASCRNYTNEVQRYARECQMHLRQVERNLRVAEADFELQYNDLMANDPEIIRMRNLSKADRDALARTKLQKEINDINQLKLALTDAGHVQTVIESKFGELKSIIRDIRLQKNLIEAEIETGAFWGNDMGDHNSTYISHGDIDASNLFEAPVVPEEDEYDNLFVFEDKNEKGIDKSEKDAKMVSDSALDKNPVGHSKVEQDRLNSETNVFEDEIEIEIDFDSALKGLG